MTVKFALTQGRDTATVFKLEDHFRDRKVMKNCIERMRQDPLARKCVEDRYRGPELELPKSSPVSRLCARMMPGFLGRSLRPALKRARLKSGSATG
jgi:hypothetical protein